MPKPGSRRMRRAGSAPPGPEALHSLGVLAFESGEHAAAAALFTRAIQSGQPKTEYCESLAAALLASGSPAAAVVCYHQALALGAHGARVHYLLGCALLQSGQLEPAAGALEKAIRLQPRFPDALCAMGATFHALDALADAEAAYRHAIALKPEYAEAWYNRGVNAVSRGQRGMAAACFVEAIRIRPSYSEAHGNLGALRHAESPMEAAGHYRQALAHSPANLQALLNLALAQFDCDELEEAEASCRSFLGRLPGEPEAHNHLGNVLIAQGRQDEAAEEFAAVLRLKPNHSEARLNLGMIDLLCGRLPAGWEGYRHRAVDRPPGAAPWEGGAAAGLRILLCAEQGLGDVLQFVRYAALVKRLGASVLLESPVELEQILRTAPGIDAIVPKGSPYPPFDCYALILDLPRILGTDLDNIPAATPYCAADPVQMGEWRERLHGRPHDRKVGIAWAGSPGHTNDRHRSMAAGELRALSDVPDIAFFSLQKGQQSGPSGVPDLFTPLGRELTDFADTAALMMNLDLVISVDTAVAHLAGALARPVWTLLPFAPDWRWLLDRDDSPWYPTMRLFRQSRRGDWAGVMERVREELAR